MKVTRVSYTVCLVFIFLSQVGCGEKLRLSSQDDPIVERQVKLPGVASLVIAHDRVVHLSVSGYADVEESIPISEDTNFRLASVSKQFTAFAAAKLIDQGKLREKDSIAIYFPQLWHFRKVTVGHLIHHLSGLPDYLSQLCEGDPKTNQDVVDFLKNERSLLFPAGQRYEYSNTGYVMLANIVAKAAGKPFAQFVSEEVFQPLGMNDSRVISASPTDIPRRAKGYSTHDNQATLLDSSPCTPIHGDGGVFTSVRDIYRWTQAFSKKKLLSEAMHETIFRPVTSQSGQIVPYGFGWRIGKLGGAPKYSHAGAWLGYRTRITWLSHEKFWVVVLSNNASARPSEITDRLIREFLDK